LFVNPGEVSGWTFGKPTVMLFDTQTREVETILLGGARSILDAASIRDAAERCEMNAGDETPR
jgi:hypothetical protein